MTQVATAPDGVGLVIRAALVHESIDGPGVMFYEDGHVVRQPGSNWDPWRSAADARAAAWDRYIDRWKDHPDWAGYRPVTNAGTSPLTWVTHP